MNSDLANDAAALLATRSTSRRRFIKAATLGSLGTGFASAALPVLSQAIKTDFAGIQSEEVTIDSTTITITRVPRKGRPTQPNQYSDYS